MNSNKQTSDTVWIGGLMRKGQDDLLVLVNAVIAQMKADGTLRQLHEKYGLVYGYE